MIGRVTRVSKINGFVAVKIAAQSYTIVEPLADIRLEVGDVLRGDLESPGNQSLRTQGRGEFEGLIHATRCPSKQVTQLLRADLDPARTAPRPGQSTWRRRYI